jgi:dipeptidyl aminopeptidase/acylaminoacyl peptidase
MKPLRLGLLVLLILLAACGPAGTVAPMATPPLAATYTILPTALATATPTVQPTATPTATSTATPTATPSPTPDPYAGLTIVGLAAREYGGGELQVEETLAVTEAFTRTLVTYPSDGLTIYGFMNVPQGEGPFPVVLVLHGYIDPDLYSTLAYTTRYADSLARAGYLVIHPNLRGYPPSDAGPDRFRVGMAVDVLNLMALVRQQGGQPGSLQQADPHAVGLWGHSMGGGIALRVITVASDVRAVVLYGSMSGDEKVNYERILYWTGGERGQEELDTPEEALRRISPIFHLERIQAAVSVHHSDTDEVVPIEWSLDLCERLQTLNKPVECFTYSGLPHTFRGQGDLLFMQRAAAFFDQYLR